MTERWLSVEEIAGHLGVKKDTVYKWVSSGQIPCHKIGRLVKFQIKEVDQWVRDGRAGENKGRKDKD